MKNNLTNELQSSVDAAAEQICELREKVKELSLIKDCSSWSGGIISETQTLFSIKKYNSKIHHIISKDKPHMVNIHRC